MPKLRGAVYGCGMISEFHLRAWRKIEEVEIVALGSRTVSRAEIRRDEFVPNARVYGELGDLLACEDLDFIDILTPPAFHKRHCLQALDAQLNVICQKPIAETFTEARELVEAFAGSQQSLVIHENHRYRDWYQQILLRASDGFFGNIRLARFEQLDSHAPREAYKLESQYGVLLEYGTHIIDMVQALWGQPHQVMASAYRLNPNLRGESLVHLTFVYPEATACVDIGWKANGPPQGSVLIIGDRGEAIYDGTMTRGESSRFRLIEQGATILDERRSPSDDYAASFYELQRAVVDAWLRRMPVPQPANANLNVLKTTFAAYQAISSGQLINVV